MDGLRQLSAERGQLNVGTAPTVAFQRAFLDNIRRNGRLNELELIARFKTQAFVKNASIPNFFKDALLAPKLMKRGKLHLRGERVQDRDVVKRIFDRCVERV
jgi:heterodisulfide reductase subunit C